jgi:hypothetical protein
MMITYLPCSRSASTATPGLGLLLRPPLLLFLGLLTLLNAPFDWASLGLTRELLIGDSNLEDGCWHLSIQLSPGSSPRGCGRFHGTGRGGAGRGQGGSGEDICHGTCPEGELTELAQACFCHPLSLKVAALFLKHRQGRTIAAYMRRAGGSN